MNQQCVSCGPVTAVSSPIALRCPKCGGRLTDKCSVCKNHHAIGTAYCVETGENIAEYEAKEIGEKKH